jgi:hypothetical protein
LKRVLRTFAANGVAVSAAVVFAVPGAQAAGTPGWRFAAVYPQVQQMLSVSASSAANAWAAGQAGLGLFTSRWNGKKWQTIAGPTGHWGVGPVVGAAVAATAGARAWIFVLTGNEELGITEADAVEWTGTSWSAMHTFAGSPWLGTAIASGPGDVWGFGNTGSDNQTPWAVHYNGKSWSRVSMPVNPSQASGSAAAGDWVMGTAVAQPKRVEVLHWSKGAWRNVALPKISVPAGQQMLPGFIAVAGPASVWATVRVGPPTGTGHVPDVLLHWNGRAWSKVPVPKGVSAYGLASDGHGGSWVASYTVIKPGRLLAGLVMYHYWGGHWTHVPAPAKSGFVTNLIGGNMQLIPGTRSVLANAILNPSRPAGFEGAILKYGP